MTEHADPRLAVIERAIRAAATTMLDITPREALAALSRSRREQMLDELARYERQGRGRAAAMLVARNFASDKHNSVEVASLARKLRRWRDEKSGQCPNVASEAG